MCHYTVITRSKYLAFESPNIAHGCKWQVVVTVRHTLEWPGSIIPISRTFSLLEARARARAHTHTHTHTHSMCFLNEYRMFGGACAMLPFVNIHTTSVPTGRKYSGHYNSYKYSGRYNSYSCLSNYQLFYYLLKLRNRDDL
jgi:hypothetical protein